MKKMNLLLVLLVILVIAGLAGGGYYFFDKYQETKQILENPDEAAKVETQKIVEKVSKLMELPTGTPTIATVLDKEKLKGQAFFAKAENGDKVIIFAESQTAILYRPSTNKLIAFAPVNLGEPKDQTIEEESEATLKPSPKPIEEPVE